MYEKPTEPPVALPMRVIARPIQPSAGSWSARYGEKHRMVRVPAPAGIDPLEKVRLYRRGPRKWLAQWWDPKAKKNLSESLQGDVIDAFVMAREIDNRLVSTKRSGRVSGKVTHADLVAAYKEDLKRRADADRVSAATLRRYDSGLIPYEQYVQQPTVARKYRHAVSIDREFALGFEAFLKNQLVHANGRLGSKRRPRKDGRFERERAAALIAWAADPDRGNLLPDSFRNPFHRKGDHARCVVADPATQPDITIPMATEFFDACDDWQLRLFAPLLLCNLRAAEPVYLFHEDLEREFLHVRCKPQIGYLTKGRRDKRIPLIEPVKSLLNDSGHQGGLIYLRRKVCDGTEIAKLMGVPVNRLAQHYQLRCQRASADAAARERIRDELLHEAGALNYDQIEGEFSKLAKSLQWPKVATLKDLRHLFLTSMNNAGMSDSYRQYFAAQAQTQAAVSRYTHLDALREQYLPAVCKEFAPVLEVLERRTRGLKAA